jgi:hypothetical protein
MDERSFHVCAMHGGLGNRKFYLAEIDRIEASQSRLLPKTSYTSEEIEAGIDKLAKAFGFYGTLLFMEKATPYKRDELLMWTVEEFNSNLTYIAWENEKAKKLQEIKERKRK